MISIEWLVVFVLVVIIKELYVINNQKPSDYDSGYRDAIREVANKFNIDFKKYNDDFESRLDEIKDFIQGKLNDK